MKDFASAKQLAAICEPPVTSHWIRRLATRHRWRSKSEAGGRGRPTILYRVQDVDKTLGPQFARRLAELRVSDSTGAHDDHSQPGSELVVVPTPGLPSSAALQSSLDNVPATARELAARRMKEVEALEAYLGQEKGSASVAELTVKFVELRNAARQQDGLKLSPRTLDRWRAAMRKPGADGQPIGLPGLIDGRAVSGAAQLRRIEIPEQLEGAFRRYWLTQHQRSVQLAWELALGECPAESRKAWKEQYPVSLFYRRMKALPEQLVVLAREGQKAWADKCEQPIFRDYETLLSNQLWCSDHHQMDLWVWDQQTRKAYRPWLTVWSDVRSRKIVAYTLELTAPNQERVLCTWADAVMQFGLPDGVYVDNGRDYRCRQFAGGRGRESRFKFTAREEEVTAVLGALKVAAHFALPYNARSKPVERWFRFLEDRFSKLWDTYCSNEPNSQKKPALCKKILADSPEQAPRIEEVREALAGFIDWFNSSWQHSGDGMHGRTPDQVYSAHLHTVRYRPTEEQLKLCLMPSEWLTVTRGCVLLTVAGMRRSYTDDAGLLSRLPKTRVKARFNPRSLSRIYLFDESDCFICSAIEQSKQSWDFSSENLREAKARQARNRRALKDAYEAQRDMLKNPDPLTAVLQERAGYAAAAGETLRLEATGTDGRALQKRLPAPTRDSSTLRIAHDNEVKSVPASSVDTNEGQNSEATRRDSWMDAIEDDEEWRAERERRFAERERDSFVKAIGDEPYPEDTP